MTQLSTTSPQASWPLTPCCYVNGSSQIQVGRISNIEGWFLERIILPGQPLFFEAPLEGQLEIHTGELASAILCDHFSCQKLQIDDPLAQELSPSSQTGS